MLAARSPAPWDPKPSADPPEVLDVRDMAGIGGSASDRYRTGASSPRLVAFQHDRYRVIGIKLTEQSDQRA